jgi:Rad3-related DNA helicase
LKLPDWVQEIRPHQQDAVDEAVEAYEAGVKAVFIDGPTGTGKTLIGEMIRQRLGTSGLYVCSDKSLQDQFLADFNYARVLKGRANYPSLDVPERTADDCTSAGGEAKCLLCNPTAACPYKVAKFEAAQADLAVLNTAYLLTEANTSRPVFSGRPFVIADEADTLESSLLNVLQYEVPRYVWQELRLHEPKKAVRKPTLIKWLAQVQVSAEDWLRNHGGQLEPKRKRSWQQFIRETATMQVELGNDLDAEDDDESGKWLRDYDTKTFKLVPVTVGRYGARKLWRHGHKWLLMSATLISPEHMADELGLPWEWECVTVPMTFPIENRPVYLAGVAEMKYTSSDEDYEALAHAIVAICDRHPNERVLVHTVSYNLNNRLHTMLLRENLMRPVITYGNAQGKQDAIELYRKRAGAVLLAPSASRGVDFKDDDCRVVVVAKAPFPSLGDRRVAARKRLPGGDAWYMVQTVRDVVQMTGRGMRHTDDYCATYLLDRMVVDLMTRRGKHLVPRWWSEAIDRSFNPRQLTRQA